MKTRFQTTIHVKVLPRSSRNQVVLEDTGVIRAKLTAPPLDGRANKALKALLAKKLGLARGDIDIIAGEHSRENRVRIRGVQRKDIERALLP